MVAPTAVPQVREWVDAEMQGHSFQMTEKWLKNVMPDLTPKQIRLAKSFIRDHHLGIPPQRDESKYRRGWAAIAKKDVDEVKHYEPFRELLHTMLETFGLLGSRSVLNTCKRRMDHSATQGGGLYSAPDLLILGAFPELNQLATVADLDSNSPEVTYANVVSGIEIKKDTQKDNHSGHLAQCSVYAREVLKAQPTRHFFYFLLLTNNHVRVTAFTRSGALHSPWINIHERPMLFIKIILGVTSERVSDIGFDDSFKWTNGALQLHYPFKSAEIMEPTALCIKGEPIVRRYHIRGRGTTCWFLAVKTRKAGKVQDRHLIAKYTWQSVDRTPTEVEVLEAAKNLDGVGQMFEWDSSPHPKTVSELFRTFADSQTLNGFIDRKMYTIFLEAYGPPVRSFETRLQFLFALIDSLRGHQALFDLGILHRDVNPENVVLGPKGCVAPNRGRIIDFDYAVWITRIGTNAGLDVRTGTRVCQSINILNEAPTYREMALAHSHLDDLESYFWLFSVGCLLVEKPGKTWDENNSIVRAWADTSPAVSRNSKLNFLGPSNAQPKMSPYMEIFRPTMVKLSIHCEAKDWERRNQHRSNYLNARANMASFAAAEHAGSPSTIREETKKDKEERIAKARPDYDEFVEILMEAVPVVEELERREMQEAADAARAASLKASTAAHAASMVDEPSSSKAAGPSKRTRTHSTGRSAATGSITANQSASTSKAAGKASGDRNAKKRK